MKKFLALFSTKKIIVYTRSFKKEKNSFPEIESLHPLCDL